MISRAGGRFVTVARRLAWAVSLVAVYLALFGVGCEIWSITAWGIGLVLVAVVLAVTAVVRDQAPMWAMGTARVETVSAPPPASLYGRCELHVVVEARGLPPTAVKVRDPQVPVAKWPAPGAILPVRVAVSNPRRLHVRWDMVSAHAYAVSDGDHRGDTFVAEDSR
jgi:hypothetical protein